MPRVNHHPVRDAVERGVRTVGAGLTVWTYTLMAPFGCVLFGLLAFAWRRDPLQRARRMQRMTVAAYRFMFAWLRLAGIVHFDPRRTLEGLPAGPCVVIANHPTLLDITAISAMLGGGCTIVKQKLYQRRLLKGLLVGAGHIGGPVADLVSIGPIVDTSVQRLRDGFSVIVFPEGTRSPAGRLHSFGRTAFEIACRAGVPLVSLTVECQPVYLSKEVPLFRPPHPKPVLRLAVLSIDDPAAHGHDSKSLRRQVEGRYRAWRAQTASAGSPSIPELKGSQCQIISKTG